MTVVLTGDWKALDDIFKRLPRRVQKNIQLATSRNASTVVTKTKKIIRDQSENWPPLKPETIERKGSSKALIEHGDLLGSIKKTEVMETVFFVGALRTARNRDGTSLADIYAVHEFGSWSAAGRSGGQSGIVPARSSLRPGLEQSEKACFTRWEKALDASLKGLKYA